MKRRVLGYVAEVKDMDRPCYFCEQERKVRVESGSKCNTVDEYCLDCDRAELKRTIRACIWDEAKFKLILPEGKLKAVMAAMQEVLGEEPVPEAKP